MDHLTIRESERTELYTHDGFFVIKQGNRRVRLTRAQAQIVLAKLAEAVDDNAPWEPGQ